MKKYLLGVAASLLGVITVLTSCDDGIDGPAYHYEVYSDGAFIINSGNMYSMIDGSLTAIDYSTKRVLQRAFAAANDGQTLGSIPNDGLIYGEKMYIVVDGSNTVEVIDKRTLKRIRQISTTELMGTAEGTSPRHIIAGNGSIYFTTYGGYVAAVDTVNFKLSAKYKVGSYPEGLAGYGENICVANSDYGRGHGSISVVNLGTGRVDTREVAGVSNPQKVFIFNGNYYVLDWVYYEGEYPNSVERGESAIKFFNGTSATKVADAYYATMLNGKFYIVSDPYGTPSYSVCDVNANPVSGSVTTLALSEGVYSPTAIEVDPATGNIFVTSNSQGEYGADYSAPGYVQEYSNSGTKLNRYETGVGPCSVVFNVGLKAIPDNR